MAGQILILRGLKRRRVYIYDRLSFTSCVFLFIFLHLYSWITVSKLKAEIESTTKQNENKTRAKEEGKEDGIAENEVEGGIISVKRSSRFIGRQERRRSRRRKKREE